MSECVSISVSVCICVRVSLCLCVSWFQVCATVCVDCVSVVSKIAFVCVLCLCHGLCLFLCFCVRKDIDTCIQTYKHTNIQTL